MAAHPQLQVPLVKTLRKVKYYKMCKKNGFQMRKIISFKQCLLYWGKVHENNSPSTTAKSSEIGIMSSSDTSSAVMAILRCV